MINMKKPVFAFVLILVMALSFLFPLTSRLEAVGAAEPDTLLESGDFSFDNPSLDQGGVGDNVLSTPLSLDEGTRNIANDYQLVWEPNNVQGSIHCVAVSDDKRWIAVGGGYLCDNEVHLYILQPLSREYIHVWDSGDEIISSDVLSVEIGDTDNDQHLEIICGSADGKIYVFEQTYGQYGFGDFSCAFHLVWSSDDEIRHQVWSVKVDDLDSDGIKEVIAGSWDGKVYIFEYRGRSGDPASEEHRHEYVKVWDSGKTISGRVYSVATGNTDWDEFKELIVGSYDHRVYVFENNHSETTASPFWPHADNSFEKVWDSGDLILGPVQSVAVSNWLDDEFLYGEIVVSSYDHGVYVFDYDPASKSYEMNKLLCPIEPWQTQPNVTENEMDPYVDAKVSMFDRGVVEPINDYFPFNTALAGPPGYMGAVTTMLDPTKVKEGVATVVLDFGEYEEITGNGNKASDVTVYLRPDIQAVREDFEFSVSKDLKYFSTISKGDVTASTKVVGQYASKYGILQIDIDPTLVDEKWESFRYMKINVRKNPHQIDAVEGTLFRPVADAWTVSIGHLALNVSDDNGEKIVIGTRDGRIIVFGFNTTTESYERVWDSFEEDRFCLDAGVWSIIDLNMEGKMPTWRFNKNLVDLTGAYITGYCFEDWDGDGDQDLFLGEYALIGLGFGEGRISYYRNDGTIFDPFYNPVSGFPSLDVTYFGSIISPAISNLNDDGNLELTVSIQNLGTRDVTFDYYERSGSSWMLDEGFYDFLEPIVEASEELPNPVFEDVDNDMDLDLTIANGQLHYYENIGNPMSPQWTFQKGFYDGINLAVNTIQDISQVSFSDFDIDGDLDATVGFMEGGFTYFVNTGTPTTPVWKEQIFLYETDFTYSIDGLLSYVQPHLVDLNNDSLPDLVPSPAPDPIWSTKLDYFTASLEHDGFLVATYPKVSWVEVDKREGFLGFEARIAWSTSKRFDNWTCSVSIGDTDEDGRKEVVVGSFDNNIYTFENLFNNTYHRAWRSPDINHVYEHKAGDMVLFSRVVWDDVTDLVLGDQDSDGKQEIIAAANSRIYIFENVGNDRYTLVWNSSDTTERPITAVNIADDLDNDTMREIVVSDGNMTYVFENSGENEYGLVWSYFSSDATIQTIATGDADGDNIGDLIIGGANDTHGLVLTLENVGDNNYMLAWTAGESQLWNSPVNSITLGDQGNNTKIIVGHNNGVNIYESAGDNQYEIHQVLTGSPSYPAINLSLVTASSITTYERPALLQLSNGTFLIVYRSYTAQGYRLFSRTSQDGASWSEASRQTDDIDYGFELLFEEQPSIVQTKDGTIWIAYRAKIFSLDDGNSTRIYVVHTTKDGWSQPELVADPGWDDDPTRDWEYALPSIWICHGPIMLGGESVGVNYLSWDSYLYGKRRLFALDWYWETPRILSKEIAPGNFTTTSHMMVRLEDKSYAVAFAGADARSAKEDSDIWVMLSNSESTIYGDWTAPAQITTSQSIETSPSIIELVDGVLMVAFKVDPADDEIRAFVSTNRGTSWENKGILVGGVGSLNSPSLTRLVEGGFAYVFCFWNAHWIGFGANSYVGWWNLRIGEVYSVCTGDTDKDALPEIVASNSKRLSVFELNSATQRYEETWTSPELGEEITEIAVGDINNNGLTEIVATARGGNVYAFEYVDPKPSSASNAVGSAETQFTPPVQFELISNSHSESFINVENRVNSEPEMEVPEGLPLTTQSVSMAAVTLILSILALMAICRAHEKGKCGNEVDGK